MGDDEHSRKGSALAGDGGSSSRRAMECDGGRGSSPIASSADSSRKCDAGIRIAILAMVSREMPLKFPSLFWRSCPGPRRFGRYPQVDRCKIRRKIRESRTRRAIFLGGLQGGVTAGETALSNCPTFLCQTLANLCQGLKK